MKQLVGSVSENHAGPKRPKPEVVVEFCTPSVSPIWKALELASQSLGSLGDELADTHWCSVWKYHRGNRSDAIKQIWRAVMPQNTRIQAKVADFVQEWPQRLVLLLSKDPAVRDKTSADFVATKRCCLKRGVRAFHAEQKEAKDCMRGGCIDVVKELAWQIDFHIFDREMSHAKTKSFLEVAQGNAHGVETVAVEQMGKEIGQLHKDTAATFADDRAGKRKRGRPRKVRPKKRARYDAWNSFVALNRPAVALELMGQEIKNGEIMKRLGKRWGSLPDSEKNDL